MNHDASIATPDRTSGVELEHATIAAVTEGGVIAHCEAGVMSLRVAAGCLLEPMAGDLVLVSRSGRSGHVLTILERPTVDRRMRIEGNLEISARRLHLSADDEAKVTSRGRADLDAPELGMGANSMAMNCGTLDVTATRAQASLDDARLHSRTIEVVGQRILQCARQVIRRVEDIESLHVGQLVQRVRSNLFCRAHRVNMTSRKDMRIDGERIHMG